mmetsp:Transcript_116096/g.248337  ORF Transcript_116096/g.248337 Transcript_116096/m.248337 type:complete len:333 (+) Transcript_116096:214-1212(+)
MDCNRVGPTARPLPQGGAPPALLFAASLAVGGVLRITAFFRATVNLFCAAVSAAMRIAIPSDNSKLLPAGRSALSTRRVPRGAAARSALCGSSAGAGFSGGAAPGACQPRSKPHSRRDFPGPSCGLSVGLPRRTAYCSAQKESSKKRRRPRGGLGPQGTAPSEAGAGAVVNRLFRGCASMSIASASKVSGPLRGRVLCGASGACLRRSCESMSKALPCKVSGPRRGREVIGACTCLRRGCASMSKGSASEVSGPRRGLEVCNDGKALRRRLMASTSGEAPKVCIASSHSTRGGGSECASRPLGPVGAGSSQRPRSPVILQVRLIRAGACAST